MKLGLVGASRIAGKILPAIRSLNEIEIAGICASTNDRAVDFGRTHDLPVLGTYNDCFQNRNIDSVYISVINSNHFNLIKLALLNDKNVICEKPLVLNQAEAIELFSLAKSRKLILLEGLMYRFHPQIVHIKNIIQSNRLGKIKSIGLSFSFILETQGTARRTSEGGGGAIYDLGCYCIDFLNSILTSKISSEILIVAKPDIYNSSVLDGQFSSIFSTDSQIISINCGIDQPSVNRWEICFEKGSLIALRFDPHGSSNSEIIEINEDSEALYEKIEISDGFIQQFKDEFDNFHLAVAGRVPPFVLPEESIKNAGILESMYKKVYGKIK